MITPEAARKFALEHFPNGPEALVQKLGITVRESEMSGCDGWCLTATQQIGCTLSGTDFASLPQLAGFQKEVIMMLPEPPWRSIDL